MKFNAKTRQDVIDLIRKHRRKGTKDLETIEVLKERLGVDFQNVQALQRFIGYWNQHGYRIKMLRKRRANVPRKTSAKTAAKTPRVLKTDKLAVEILTNPKLTDGKKVRMLTTYYDLQ